MQWPMICWGGLKINIPAANGMNVSVKYNIEARRQIYIHSTQGTNYRIDLSNR